MSKLVERRCSCCGHIYKHEDYPIMSALAGVIYREMRKQDSNKQ